MGKLKMFISENTGLLPFVLFVVLFGGALYLIGKENEKIKKQEAESTKVTG